MSGRIDQKTKTYRSESGTPVLVSIRYQLTAVVHVHDQLSYSELIKTGMVHIRAVLDWRKHGFLGSYFGFAASSRGILRVRVSYIIDNKTACCTSRLQVLFLASMYYSFRGRSA